MHVNSLVNPRSEPLFHFPKAFAAMAVRMSGSEWWTPARWRVGIEIDPSPTRVKTLRVLLELESLESTLESQKKTPHVSWESFDIFIESGLFRLGGAQISGGKNHEAQTLPFKAYMVKLLAEHCGKGKGWVYVAWYAHASLWKIPMVGWDLLGAFLAYTDNTVHPNCMQIFVFMYYYCRYKKYFLKVITTEEIRKILNLLDFYSLMQ